MASSRRASTRTGMSERALRRALHARHRRRLLVPRLRRRHPPAPARPPQPDALPRRGYKEEGTTTTPFDMVVLNRDEPLPPRAWRRSGARRSAPSKARELSDEHCREMLAPPRGLRPRALRGHARDPRLDVGGLNRASLDRQGSDRQRGLLAPQAHATRRQRRTRSPTTRSSMATSSRSADGDDLRAALDSPIGAADAIGHRLVHGGEHVPQRGRGSTRPSNAPARPRDWLRCTYPSPLPHSMPSLGRFPHLPAVACFDTAFHATLPMSRRRLRAPGAVARALGPAPLWLPRPLPRVGCAAHAELLQRDPVGLRIVSCHLGAGASLCAINDGRSLDTTMGFTPLEGLVMATRAGSVDPGILLWLLEHGHLAAAELTDSSSTIPVCWDLPAAPTCARCSDEPRTVMSLPASHGMSTSTVCAPRSLR